MPRSPQGKTWHWVYFCHTGRQAAPGSLGRWTLVPARGERREGVKVFTGVPVCGEPVAVAATGCVPSTDAWVNGRAVEMKHSARGALWDVNANEERFSETWKA